MTTSSSLPQQTPALAGGLLQKTFSVIRVLGASIFIALCSQLEIILPFSPIPITLQTFAILLVGATLGSRHGSYAVLAYYAQILAGLPVTAGGTVNPLIFFGPRAGYVIGFVFQAYLMGWFTERMSSYTTAKVFAAALVASAVQLALGAGVLSLFIGTSSAFWLGFVPFIPGGFLKTLALCSTLKWFRKT